MDLTAVTLTELRYLVAIAETGHFGRAAATCCVTQPTLSAQLKKLEDNLGVALIERGSRRALLTPAGQRVVERARLMLDHLGAIGDTARGHSDPLDGELRLGVIPTLGPYLLPLLLRPLQKDFPLLRLVVIEQLTAVLIEELVGHRLDAALLAMPVDAAGIETTALFDEPFSVLAPAQHPLTHKAKLHESDLQQHRVLLLAEGHCLRDQALAICGQQHNDSGADFRATSLETLGHLVAAGMGCTLLPALAVPRRSDRHLAVLPFAAPVPHRRIGLAWRRSFPRPDALRALGDFVRQHVRNTNVEVISAAPAARQES